MARHTTRPMNRTRIMRRPDTSAWPAAIGVALLLAAAILLFSRDIQWLSRARAARARAAAGALNGQIEVARDSYGEALNNDPYDWEDHLSLARILYHWLDDHENALRHYLYARAYCHDPAVGEEIDRAVAILSLMREGGLEDPGDALEDMFAAVEADSEFLFRQRLTGAPLRDSDLFWRAWRERGRGKVIYHSITPEPDGGYDAMIGIDYPDGVNMNLRLTSRRHDIWRLYLSFP